MGLRILLIASAVVAILFGGLFLFSPDGAIAGFQLGDSTIPARLFARAFGLALLLVGVLNLMASRDSGSTALTAILVFNLLLHLGSPIIDFTEPFPKTGGYWVGLVVHVVFVLGFGYYLFGRGARAAPA